MTNVRFTIDGIHCTAPAGTSLVEAAGAHSVEIPSLCYFPHINPPLATCRVCSVEVNGRLQPACLVEVTEGMQVVFDTPALRDERKAIVELMFAEGNHFCPSCEKNGDCDLQHLGTQTGVTATLYPHLFEDRIIDFHPKRLVIEHNRCIKCMRCVEEVHAPDGRKVFSFVGRGHDTRVGVDYEAEALLSEAEAARAMHICPVGAILVRGKSLGRPPGERKYDAPRDHNPELAPLPVSIPKTGSRRKRVATTSLAGCFGCHMSMLDIDLGILDVVEVIDLGKSPLTDVKVFDGRYDLGLIEGGCANSENIHSLLAFRKNCDILVSIGECAIWGGVPAMRNTVPLSECLEESFLHSMTSSPGESVIPAHEEIPKLLDRVYACHEVVRIDHFIPGCPPSADYIWKSVLDILFGNELRLPGQSPPDSHSPTTDHTP